MPKILLLTGMLLLACFRMTAQTPLPLIRAGSKDIRIIDGDDTLQGVLVPHLPLDIYPYHKSSKPKKVSYYTDVDSISFTVNKGDTYDFGIVLNGRDTCYQRITYDNPNKVQYLSVAGTQASNDTFPIRLGANNAIHLKGTINGSDTLDLIFDTGASVGVLTEEGRAKKATLKDGNHNEFTIGNVRIGQAPVKFIDYRGRLKADGVLGYNAFEDKVVEINYDKGILVIHHRLPSALQGYTTLEMKWRGTGIFLEGALHHQNKEYKGLFLFDTGSKWALSLNKRFCAQYGLYGTLPEVGTRRAKGADGRQIKSTTVLAPQFRLGNLVLPKVPADLEEPSKGEGLPFNILGNDVLKRFNVVLDFPNGLVYLQPNGLTTAPYNRNMKDVWWLLLGGIIVALTVAGVVFYRKRKKRLRA